MAKLGAGDRANRPAGPAQTNNLYVVNLPPPAKNSTEWLSSARGPQGVSRISPQPTPGFTPFLEEIREEATEGSVQEVLTPISPTGYTKSRLFD